MSATMSAVPNVPITNIMIVDEKIMTINNYTSFWMFLVLLLTANCLH